MGGKEGGDGGALCVCMGGWVGEEETVPLKRGVAERGVRVALCRFGWVGGWVGGCSTWEGEGRWQGRVVREGGGKERRGLLSVHRDVRRK